MSFEKPSAERGPEQLPTEAEVKARFERYLNGKAYKVLRVEHDEKGLRTFEIESTQDDGDKLELNYQPAQYDYTDPSLPHSLKAAASIHTIIYMGEFPVSGDCIANYINGKWEDVK